MSPGNTEYPSQHVTVISFPAEFASLFPRPAGLIHNNWPPDQVTYLGLYLTGLGCKSIIVESHYVDKDYILDLSAFYARSLRNYPNYCKRMHFLSCEFSTEQWTTLFDPVIPELERSAVYEELQRSYLGFTAIKPLPGCPIGRTVLRTFPATTTGGSTRFFGAIRRYEVHLGGFDFTVEGLAFQQQDQGVSACATTALWSSLHKVAHEERILVPTPAQITEAASRYLLAEGRSFPSEGLNIQQICEAIRGSGLQPLVIRSVSAEEDRAQIVAYVNSGFPPVLAIQPLGGGSGHAICAVGLKMGDASTLVAPAHHPHHSRLAESLQALYVHDDRLGPYAVAQMSPWTHTENNQTKILTALQIQWPDKTQAEMSILRAMVVPVPDKIRMPVSRLLASGAVLAELTGLFFKEFEYRVILNVAYLLGTRYRQNALDFGLTKEGLYTLCCGSVLPRFVGLVEVMVKEGPLYDVLLDTTETRANPSALLFVRRSVFPKSYEPALRALADQFGAKLIA